MTALRNRTDQPVQELAVVTLRGGIDEPRSRPRVVGAVRVHVVDEEEEGTLVLDREPVEDTPVEFDGVGASDLVGFEALVKLPATSEVARIRDEGARPIALALERLGERKVLMGEWRHVVARFVRLESVGAVGEGRQTSEQRGV